jgi:hypothetical protein
MISFTSSFRSVVFARETRAKYATVAGTLLLVVLVVSVCCQVRISRKNAAQTAAYRSLDQSTRIIIAGSSHLLGQNSETIGLRVVNVSHAANSLRMLYLTLRKALYRAPHVQQVVLELGHIVLTSDPTRLRGHSFVELGLRPWELPGTPAEKLWRCVERFPPLRVSRLTPKNLVSILRPELNASAQGFKPTKIGNYIENGKFRAARIHMAMEKDQPLIDDNMAALEELLTLLTREKSVKVLILVTPHTVHYREEMNSQEVSMLQRAESICQQFPGVTVLDLYNSDSHGFTLDHFGDSDHLNNAGRELLGKTLSLSLREQAGDSGDASPK